MRVAIHSYLRRTGIARATPEEAREIWSHLEPFFSEVCARTSARDPGNPQPPLTAYIRGQADHRALDVKRIMEELLRYAAMRGNEISKRMIFRSVEHFAEPEHMMKAVERITRELQNRGVKIWR